MWNGCRNIKKNYESGNIFIESYVVFIFKEYMMNIVASNKNIVQFAMYLLHIHFMTKSNIRRYAT